MCLIDYIDRRRRFLFVLILIRNFIAVYGAVSHHEVRELLRAPHLMKWSQICVLVGDRDLDTLILFIQGLDIY